MLQSKVNVAQNAAYCYHLALFAMRLPGVDEDLLQEFERDMKRMRANALSQLELLLLELIMMVMKLLFGEVAISTLAYFCAPVEKRFGFSFQEINVRDEQIPEWINNMSYKIAQSYYVLDGAMQTTEGRANDWLADRSVRTKDKVVEMFKRGELDDFIQRLRDDDPAHAPMLVREVFDLLNIPEITRAAEKREQQADGYRKRGWW